MSSISEDTSKRITALRFLLIVFVVFIHNNFTTKTIAEEFEKTGVLTLFKPNAFSKWTQLFISQGIARCAVPLFFLFAAYLQAEKNDTYPTLLKKRAKSLLLPFVIWTAIYSFYFAGLKLIILKVAPQFIKTPENTALNWTVIDWVHKLLGYRQKADGTGFELPEFAYQFWFIRDLIILVILSPLLKALIKKFPICFFSLVSVTFITPIRVYFVENQALFFYVTGLYLGSYEANDKNFFNAIDKIKYIEAIFLFILSFVADNIVFAGKLHWFVILLACVLLLKTSALIVENDKAYSITKYLAGYSFFLFAIHTPVMNEMLKRIWLHFLPMTNPFFCLAEYFGVAILNIALGTSIGIALKKLCPRLFALLTGGR
jgi:peptidoglycan/LPS O-acetylase OafA/YrhL